LRLLPSPGSIERMAVPARPASPADARVACPTCGGLIHPVAGRCKHCKTDLSAAHATRLARHAAPQVAALPALGGAAAAAAAPAPGPAAPSSPWAPPQAGAAPADATRPLAPFSEVPVPVSGRVGETPRPLPGGSGTASTEEAPGVSRWVWWVVGISAVVIIVMIVVLVWPQGKKSTAPRVGAAGDSMSTSPLPDRSGGGGATTPDPWATPSQPAPATPDARTDDVLGSLGALLGGGGGSGSGSLDDTLTDLFNSLGGGGLGGGGTGGASSAPADFLGGAADALCDRLTACGTPAFMCAQTRSLMNTMGRSMFGQCSVDDSAAESCIDSIKALSCRDVELGRLPSTAQRIAPRCMRAMDCPSGTGAGLSLDDLMGGLGGLGGGGRTGP
jgi:hypothetical protein